MKVGEFEFLRRRKSDDVYHNLLTYYFGDKTPKKQLKFFKKNAEIIKRFYAKRYDRILIDFVLEYSEKCQVLYQFQCVFS